MLAWFKFLTVWLLALAIPVQGLAAVRMTHCGNSHERMHGAVVHQQAAAGHADAHAGHAGEHHAAQPDKATIADPLGDLAQYKCAACGACCTAAGMPVAGLLVPESLPVAHWENLPVLGEIGFVTSGPDRPPRPLLG